MQLLPREFQITELVWKRLRYREIAARLQVKEESVAQFVHRISRKLRLSGRAQLIEWFQKEYPTQHRRGWGYIHACIAFAESWARRGKTAREYRHHLEWAARPSICYKPRPQRPGRTPAPEDTLMPREFEVCELLAEGGRNVDVGLALGIGEECVRKHLLHIMQKTGTETRITLCLWFAAKYPTPEAIKEGYAAACRLKHASKRRAGQAGAFMAQLAR